MNEHAAITRKQEKSAAAGHPHRLSSGRHAVTITDNRNEAIVQRKLIEGMNNSPQVKRAATMQRMLSGTAPAQQEEPVKKKISNPEQAPIQGAFVYRFALNQVIEDQKPDDYYEAIGFVAVLTASGKTVWCNEMNIGAVINELVNEGEEIMNAAVLKQSGISIEQDGLREHNAEDQEYYHIGHGLAWTTRIRTCTAMAIYDSVTGLSFLCHADGGDGNYERVIEHLGEYLRQVPDQDYGETLTVNIFTAEDTMKDVYGVSLDVITSAAVQMRLPLAHIINVVPDDTVAVFAAGPPIVLSDPAIYLKKLIIRYSNAPAEGLKTQIRLMIAQDEELLTPEISTEFRYCYRTLQEQGEDTSFVEQFVQVEAQDDDEGLSNSGEYSSEANEASAKKVAELDLSVFDDEDST